MNRLQPSGPAEWHRDGGRKIDRQVEMKPGKRDFEVRQKVSGIKRGLEEKREYIDMRRMKRR